MSIRRLIDDRGRLHMDLDGDPDVPVKTRWLKLGLLLAVLHYLFLAVLLVLLDVDPTLGVSFAVIVSVVGALALVVIVLRS